MNINERRAFEQLVLEFVKIFVTTHAKLPMISLERHKIELMEGTIPVRARQYRMAPDKISVLKAEINHLLEGKFIIPVTNTQWVSPVIIVPKKGGKWRIYIDFRALNKITKKDRQSLPHINQMLDEVSCHEMLSTYDGYAGYQQVGIWRGDILKTTFTMLYGTFAWLRMSLGLCNAGGTF